MTAIQEQIPTGYVSSASWIRLKTGSYADPNMLMGADGEPLTSIKLYQGHLALKRLSLRSIDDIEFNHLVDGNPEAAKQMRHYAVWTSLLRNVEKAKSGYNAMHIARPEVSMADDSYNVGGMEKPIKLPKGGWFTIKHILQSDDGLPHETFEKPPDEPSAYFWIAEGEERPVSGGIWGLRGRGRFGACALWGPFGSRSGVGVRGASDKEPTTIVFARTEATEAIEKIGQKYGLKPAEVIAALG